MFSAVKRVLGRYAQFSGRATRPEFWWWVLFMVLLTAILQIVDGQLIAPLLGFEDGDLAAGQPLSTIVSLILILPNIAVSVRRLHDIGRSGWWLLLVLVPVLGPLVLIYFYVQPSDQDSNPYGMRDPLPRT